MAKDLTVLKDRYEAIMIDSWNGRIPVIRKLETII